MRLPPDGKFNGDWPGWRGRNRDGRVAWLPESLPRRPQFLWERPLVSRAMSGVAVVGRHAIVADRELDDSIDAFLCLDTLSGKELWSYRCPAPGSLDYGNAPRATPLIEGNRVFVLGAFGHFHCLSLETGDLIWSRNLRTDFGADDRLVWGACSSPIIVDGKLIVNPGSKDASIVALKPADGSVLWKTPGSPAAFASFITADFLSAKCVIGFDAVSIGAWDVATGIRRWTLVPPRPKDFNVPTAMLWNDKLIAVSENNGTRMYAFEAGGAIRPQPIAVHRGLAPDSHTPVIVKDRLFGIWNALYCLDLRQNLKTIFEADDPAFSGYANVVASDDRVLCMTQEGELVLLDANAEKFEPISRLRLFDDDRGVYSHPAFAGRHMYIRNSSAVVCLKLAD